MKCDELANSSVRTHLFGQKYELLTSVTELFELDVAYFEKKALNEKALIERSAYFKTVNGKPTKHFLRCSQNSATIQGRSAAARAYFEEGQFSTVYATHGLFPYRGKFHPQLIRGILNIIRVQEGETILDPMCGSGTANIEAALMGINSIAVDVSPFCQLMTKARYDALTVEKETIEKIKTKPEQLFEFFIKGDVSRRVAKLNNPEKIKAYEISLLAFLDAMGYARRVSSRTHNELFSTVLNRYLATIESVQSNPFFDRENLGSLKVLANSDATHLEIEDCSIDAVITSPPYSFAIDYVENDAPQLAYLGYNIEELRAKMIGLKGRNKNDKLSAYFTDMESVCSEVSRVLKKGRFLVIIIGSNTNQTGGIRLEGKIIEACDNKGLKIVKSILKPIKGMRNTMKDEYILFFRKEGEHELPLNR
jgi:DNA modification methylase